MTDREWQDEQSDVRVIAGGEASELAYLEQKQRTAAQKLQDQLLDTAGQAFTEARALVEKGLEALTVLGVTSPNRNAPTLLGQMSEEVEAVRRVRL